MNIKKYYLYKFFKELMPIYPVYMILFESKEFNIFEISMLLTIWSVPVVILEIPSGIIADRWSRKNLLVIGSFLKTLCFVFWLFADGFIFYAVGFVLWGVSIAFCSGAEEALIFDSLKSIGKENTFDKVLGRGNFLSGLSVAVASLCGGFIAMYSGMNSALIISVFFGALAVGIAASFHEINHYKSAKSDNIFKIKGMLKDELLFFKNKWQITIVVLIAILVVGTAGILDEFDQLIAKGFGLSVGAVGLWVSFRSIVAALGSLLAPYLKTAIEKFLHIRKRIYVIGIICIAGAVLLGLAGGIKQLWTMTFYGLYFFLMAACQVLEEDYLQQRIEEEGRSTVHSIISLTYNLFGILFYGILGIVFAVGDLFTGMVFIAIYMIVLVTLLSLFYSIKLRKNTD